MLGRRASEGHESAVNASWIGKRLKVAFNQPDTQWYSGAVVEVDLFRSKPYLIRWDDPREKPAWHDLVADDVAGYLLWEDGAAPHAELLE